MPIVIPILTEYNNRGLKSALSEINRADSTFAQLGVASRLAGVAMAGAAAGAGLLAVKLGVDAVQAAIEDEAAMESLSRTLDNVGGAGHQREVEDYITRLQRMTGVSDGELRPAMERILRSVNDVGDAQEIMALAVDVSAGAHKSLAQTVDALSAAYDGNFGKLSKLGTGIDKSVLATKDMDRITAELASTFSGQAATAASTLQGRIARVTTAASEASEEVGRHLIGAFDELSNVTGGTDGAIDTIETAGDELSTIIDISAKAAAALWDLVDATEAQQAAQEDANAAGNGANGWIENLVGAIPLVGDAYVELMNGQQRAAAAANTNANAVAAETARYVGLANAARAAANAVLAANAARANKAVADRYQALALHDYGKTVSYTGGNLSTYFDVVDDVIQQTGGTSGGSTGKTLTAAQKAAAAAFDKLSDSVDGSKDALSAAGRELDDARRKLTDYADTTRDWLTSGIDLGSAYSTYLDTIAEAADLDKRIAAAIADGDSDGAAKLAAERAGVNTAASWWDGFQAQIADSKAAGKALESLTATLNPADTLGNELLLEQIRGMDPAEAIAAVDYLVKNGLGPGAAASLSEVFGSSGQVSTALATTFYGSGVTAAENQYTAIKTTLEGKLATLYALGKKLGDAVADGWNSAISNLPADVKLPAGSTRAGGDTYVTHVTAGVGNPVAIAAAVEAVQRSARRRVGS